MQIHQKACAHVAGGLLAVCVVVTGGCSDEASKPTSEATSIEYVRNAPDPVIDNNVPPFAGASHLHPVQGDSKVDAQVRPADFSWQQSGPTLPAGVGQKLNAADAWNEELRRSSQPGRPAESLYPRESTGNAGTSSAPHHSGDESSAAGGGESVASAPRFQPPTPWAVPNANGPELTQNDRQPPPPETYGPRFDFGPRADANTGSHAGSTSENVGSTAEHPYPQARSSTQQSTASQSTATIANAQPQSLPWKNTPWESRPRGTGSSLVQLPPAVARRSEELTKRAFELAGRGATYSAREQLIRALEVVAESLDAAEQSVEHRRALAGSFRALDEAVDFAPRGATLLQEIDINTVVSGHLTPVIKEAGINLDQVSAIECSRAYYTYAQQKLAFACGSQQAASLALYGLGKLNAGLAESGTDQLQDAATRSIVFHQAALSVDDGNWRAANELAVQLARSSRYEEARGWLQHATQLSDSPELWSNLAAVHGYLGQDRLAREASARSERLAQRTQPQNDRFKVQWMPPQAFTGAPPNR